MHRWILSTQVLVNFSLPQPCAIQSPLPHQSDQETTVSVQADYKTQHASGGSSVIHPPGRLLQGDSVGMAALPVRAGRALVPTRHSLTDSTVSSCPRAAAPEQAASDATKRCQAGQCRHPSGRAVPTPDASLPRVPGRDVTVSRVSFGADGRPQRISSDHLADLRGSGLTGR